MYKLSLQRILVIIAICLVGVFFAVPNVVTDKTNLPKWWQPVNLGLDLQGGSSLLLQVKMDDVLKDKMATLEDSVAHAIKIYSLIKMASALKLLISKLVTKLKRLFASLMRVWWLKKMRTEKGL